METITRNKWKSLHRDYKSGSPQSGTARVLRFVPGVGTCLVPVRVVDDESPIARTMDRHEATLASLI